MKNALLFLTMMLTALIAHSQQKDSTLTKLELSSDSLRGFPLEERKTMLKIFSDKRFNDAQIIVLEDQKGEMQRGIVERDQMISAMKSINENLKNQADNKDIQLNNCMDAFTVLERKNNMLKSFARGGLVFGIVGILFGLVK